LYFNLERMSM